MLRHVIAPAHSYAQIPNAILRHPRLSPHAKTLLNWQLSLPPGDKQCLSDTARKAGVKKSAFQNAKVELKAEGYCHEWKRQVEGGRFVTEQLVSNVPLSAKEALAVRDGLQAAPSGARLTREADGPPSAGFPAVGQPTCRTVGRLPEENIGENTFQPTGPAHESDAASEETATGGEEAEPQEAVAEEAQGAPGGLAAAESLLRSLAKVDPQLALPARTARRWAPLAVKWLDSGLSPLRVRNALTEGLENARKPLGVIHWRLQHAQPDVPPALPLVVDVPTREPRVPGMRECEGHHTQPCLFTPPPGTDEKLCPVCRARAPQEHTPPPLAERPGYAAYVEARQAQSSASSEARLRVTGRRRRRPEQAGRGAPIIRVESELGERWWR